MKNLNTNFFGANPNDNEPLDKGWFLSDGSINVERHTLDFGEDLPQMEIRKIYGIWEYMAYRKVSNGHEVWRNLPHDEEYILSQIEKYGI